jgi:hypothetical protein
MGRETRLKPIIRLDWISREAVTEQTKELTSRMAERGLSWYEGRDGILREYRYAQGRSSDLLYCMYVPGI